jgi:hypothetical protein
MKVLTYLLTFNKNQRNVINVEALEKLEKEKKAINSFVKIVD